jgi:hypothetical protein
MSDEPTIPAPASKPAKAAKKPAKAGPLRAAPNGYFMYGQEVQVTVGGYVFTGTIGQSADTKQGATRTMINDAATGGLTTDMFHNRVKSGSVTGIVLATGFTEPEAGDVIEINSVACVCLGSSLKLVELAAQVTIEWDLHASMTGEYV